MEPNVKATLSITWLLFQTQIIRKLTNKKTKSIYGFKFIIHTWFNLDLNINK